MQEIFCKLKLFQFKFSDDIVTFSNVEQEVLRQDDVYHTSKDLTATGNDLKAKTFLDGNFEMFLNQDVEGILSCCYYC